MTIQDVLHQPVNCFGKVRLSALLSDQLIDRLETLKMKANYNILYVKGKESNKDEIIKIPKKFRQKGFNVEIATGLVEAKDLIEHNRYGLIIFDLDLFGIERKFVDMLISKIEELPSNQSTPIIIVGSIRSQEGNLYHSSKNINFLRKPLTAYDYVLIENIMNMPHK